MEYLYNGLKNDFSGVNIIIVILLLIYKEREND